MEYLGCQAGLSVELVLEQGSWWMRAAIALNWMLRPFAGSRWAFLGPVASIFIVANNLAFGWLDSLFRVQGETVNHLVLYRKP
jgi:hypothetical protein